MSRLLWFLVGAGAATWYSEHREWRRQHGPGAAGGPGWGPWGCHNRQMQQRVAGAPADGGSSPSHSQTQQPQTEGEKRGSWGWGAASQTQAGSRSSSPAAGYPSLNWEEESARIMNMTKHAGDAATDLSESALDSLQSTLETLKAKLVHHRAEREAMRQQEEERRRTPPRYV